MFSIVLHNHQLLSIVIVWHSYLSVSRVINDCLWLSMDIYGFVYGCLWLSMRLSMVVYCRILSYMAVYGVVHGCIWLSMVVYCFLWLYIVYMVVIGYIWLYMGCIWSSTAIWLSMVVYGFLWLSLVVYGCL